MLKKHLFFIIIFLNSVCSISQQLIVKNATTKIPVSYANFSLFKDEQIVQGGYCSKDGEILINKDLKFDNIIVSCIGYENLDVAKGLILNDTLLLKPTVYHLKEVIVKSNKKQEFATLGLPKAKLKSLLGAFKGFEICTFIENPYHETKTIHSFLLKIRNPNKSKVGFRLHLYEIDSIKRTPKKELLTQDIIVIVEGNTKELIEHDVTIYNLELPSNGAFVGIEWFGVFNEETNTFEGENIENGYIEINDQVNALFTFRRSRFSFFPWSNMERFKKDTAPHQHFKNYPNASFGLKVYKE